jgi:cytochrome c biogenesis protein CcdA
MKRLSNISPFILLLVPIFIMMLLTLSNTNNKTENDQVALKTTNSSLVKAATEPGK